MWKCDRINPLQCTLCIACCKLHFVFFLSETHRWEWVQNILEWVQNVAFMCIVLLKLAINLSGHQHCYEPVSRWSKSVVKGLSRAWVNAVWVKLHVPLSDTSGTSTTAVKRRREKIHLFLQQPVVLVFNTQTLKTQHEPICYLLPRHKLFSLSAEW